MATGVLDRELQLDTPKKGRRRVKDERVSIFLELSTDEIGDPTVVVGLLRRDEFSALVELYANTAGRLATLGIENVRRDGRGARHESDRHSNGSPCDLPAAFGSLDIGDLDRLDPDFC